MIDRPMTPPSSVPGAEPAGRTVIGDPAAAKIAAIAARAVPGVHALGAGTGRALGAIRDAVGANDVAHGVKVEVGQTQVAVDISLIAEYGFPLDTLADTVRSTVFDALTDLVGLEVVEINVEILDVHLPQPADTRGDAKPAALASSGARPAARATTVEPTHGTVATAPVHAEE